MVNSIWQALKGITTDSNSDDVSQVIDLISRTADPKVQELIRDTYVVMKYSHKLDSEELKGYKTCLEDKSFQDCADKLKPLLHGWRRETSTGDIVGQYDEYNGFQLDQFNRLSSPFADWDGRTSVYLRYFMTAQSRVGLESLRISSDSIAEYAHPTDNSEPYHLRGAQLASGGFTNWQDIYFRGSTKVDLYPNGQIKQGILGGRITRIH